MGDSDKLRKKLARRCSHILRNFISRNEIKEDDVEFEEDNQGDFSFVIKKVINAYKDKFGELTRVEEQILDQLDISRTSKSLWYVAIPNMRDTDVFHFPIRDSRKSSRNEENKNN